MFIDFFFYFMCVTMMVFNVFVNDTVQLLYISITLYKYSHVMNCDCACNSHHCCDDCWLSEYYNCLKLTDINKSTSW